MKKLLLPMLVLLASTGLWAQTKSTGTVTLTSNMTAKFDMNNATSTVTLTLTGPADRWFALQFGTFPGTSGGGMSPGQDLVYFNGTTLIDAVHNGVGATPSADTNNWSVSSNSVSGSTRTIIATRPFNTGDSNDFTFTYSLALIDMAWARGSGASFTMANHGGTNRGYQMNKTFSCIPPGAPTASAQTFCSGATVTNLTASGDAGATFSWYSGPTGGTALSTSATLSSGTYYVSQTVSACESTRTAVTVNVVNITAQSVADVTSCGAYTLPALNANNNYYTAPGGTGSMLNAGASVTESQTIYIYAQSGTTPNCTDEGSFIVTVNPVPTAPTAADQDFCSATLVSNLAVTGQAGASFSWYNVATGGTALAANANVTSGTYYVSQTVSGCESARTAVNISAIVMTNPIVSDQSFCDNVIVGLIEVTTTGTEGFFVPVWYTTPTGGTALDINAVISTSGTYYVSETNGTCESGREAVNLTFNPTPAAPTGTATQDFNTGETIADLTVTTENGAVVTWYVMNASMQLEEVPVSTVLADEGEYYATQTVNGCESEPFMVTANEVLDVEQFNAGNVKLYPNPVKETLTVSAKENIINISIVNLLGQELINLNHENNEVKVDLASLQTGTYIVRVATVNAVSTYKIIKE